MINELRGRKSKSILLQINEIIEVKYPTTMPKDYFNIVNFFFATTGNRFVENNFPHTINNAQPMLRINTNNISNYYFSIRNAS